MRTTINLHDELLTKAQDYTGIKEKTRLIHLGLEALIQREAVRCRTQKQAGASEAQTKFRYVFPRRELFKCRKHKT